MAPLGLGTGFYRLGPTLDQSATICGPDLFTGAWGSSDGETADGPKLLHWYKFNTKIATNGTGVIRWDDQKGSNHLVPAATNDASEQPELLADGTIRFQQNTDSLVFGSALSLGAFSIYFVHKFRLGETVSSEVMFEGSADSLKFASANEARWKCSSRQDFDIPSANQIDEDTKYIFGVERNGDGDVAMYKDNIALLAKDGDDLNEAISTTFDITQVGDPNGDSQWYEIVVIDSALTTEQRNCLYSYLLTVG